MTAPDDFEAWMAREIAENGGVEFGADYRHWALKGYRAGHADLSGDVRELVEAARSYRSAVDGVNSAMRDGVNVHGALSAICGAEENLDAALAKFAQEKP